MRRLTFAVLAAVSPLFAQGSLGPSLGFVSSGTPAELQPIMGVNGSARLGDPLTLPDGLTQVYLAPGHSFALAAQGANSPVCLLMLRVAAAVQARPALTILPGSLAQPDLVAFSPTGSSAVLYSQTSSHLQVFTGLPNSPQISLNIEKVPLASNLSKLAISDDAQILLAADASGLVYAISASNAPVPVFHSSEISALAFVSQSHDAVVADPVQGTITILQTSTAAAQVKLTLAPSVLDDCQPEAATSTADGTTILIGCPGQHAVLSIDHASGAVNGYKVSNTPSAFDSLAARDTFLMSPPENGTYWLLKWQPSGPVISFVGAFRHLDEGPSN